MLSRLLAPFVAQERLRDEVSALGTRVAQLERERSALAIEHAERVSALDALVRRLGTRIQRAEALREGKADSDDLASGPSSRDVLSLRRSIRGY